MIACPDRGAEREPDDRFRSQTVVCDRQEAQGMIACPDRGAEREPDRSAPKRLIVICKRCRKGRHGQR